MAVKQIRITCTGAATLPIDDLVLFQGELKKLSEENEAKLRTRILRHGVNAPIFVWKTKAGVHYVMDGHQRIHTLLNLRADGYEVPDLPIVYIEAKNKKEAKDKLLGITSQYGEFTDYGFYEFIEEIGMPEDIVLATETISLGNAVKGRGERPSLYDRFVIPPFSVLDANSGTWGKRKTQWLQQGIVSSSGRDAPLLIRRGNLLEKARNKKSFSEWTRGQSVFDPVLAELVIRWFSGRGALVVDPFSGGSVRGIVAAMLERRYIGVDVRQEQVDANRDQAARLGVDDARWFHGDARSIDQIIDAGAADLVFTCPPHGSLEVYSNQDDDVSAMKPNAFMAAIRKAVQASYRVAKNDSFIVYVVAEFRLRDGSYPNFVGKVIEWFQEAGALLYNEAVLYTKTVSTALVAGSQFEGSRKLAKTHQNIIVFKKGDPDREDLDAEEAEASFKEYSALARRHESVLVFVKGDATKATKKAGPVVPGDVPLTAADDIQPIDSDVEETTDEDPTWLTPVTEHGPFLLKRDDHYAVNGVCGGKVRTCVALAQGSSGLVTAGSRQSPQANIVAAIAEHFRVPCRVHCPTGELSPELLRAQEHGAEVVQHKPGYNSVIIARARADAKRRGWTEIPFGMETEEVITQVAPQAAHLPFGKFARLVVPVGSGMTLAGILHGLERQGQTQKAHVLGVQVGADPTKRLDTYAPAGWRDYVTLVKAPQKYHESVNVELDGITLDPIYEAKCAQYLEPGDLLWIVGIRETA